MLDLGNQFHDFFRRPGKEANIVTRVKVIGIVEAGCEYLINRNPRIIWSEEDLVVVVPRLPMIRAEVCYLDRIIMCLRNETVDGVAEVHAEVFEFLEEDVPSNGAG